MSETITVISTAEDITELTWEDLVFEMAEGDNEDYPDHTVSTSGSSSGGGGASTCVTAYTSTGAACNGL